MILILYLFLSDRCKPGEYSPTGLQPCTKCSVGTYTDTHNSTICQSCPPGNSTLSTGKNSLQGCIGKSYSNQGTTLHYILYYGFFFRVICGSAQVVHEQ